MILLTVDEIIDFHKRLIEATGGSSEMRDSSLLESAVYNAIQSFDDEEIYKSVEEKAARLAFAIIKNHAFVDGNKRIGAFVMLITLQLNSVPIMFTQQELITLGVSIAESAMSYIEILAWINSHKT